MRVPLLWLVAMTLAAAEPLPPREAYNRAVEDLGKGDLDAAERGFSEARDHAGWDAELRSASAYNLAHVYAARATTLQEKKPSDALAQLRQAAAWFRDALRVRPDDEDARHNIEVILKRIQVLAARLNQGTDGLEARLDRLIEDQRGLRDAVRGLVDEVDRAGAGSEPAAFQDSFRSASSWERTLLADADTLAELAAEELQKIDATPEEKRGDAERVRQVQLGNLELHLEPARQRMADAQSHLLKLSGDPAHRKAANALDHLKRAREQLQDPVTVLKGILYDQATLAAQTAALAAPPSVTTKEEAPPGPPTWLTTVHLEEGQRDAHERTRELSARLDAGAKQAQAKEEQPQDPRLRQFVQAASEALPSLAEADERMSEATTALAGGKPSEAVDAQRKALEALARALERFSGIRDLIELACADQEGCVTLLTPPAEGSGEPPLPTEERARLLEEAVSRNRERVERLKGMFEVEVAELERRKEAPAPPEGQPQGQGDSKEAAEKGLERYRLAEEARRAAAEGLERLAKALAAEGDAEAPLPIAREARERLLELRRLFFTIVEHLEELIRRQAETRDRTAAAAGEKDEEKRKGGLGAATDGQRGHAADARAIARSLQEMASPPAGPDAAQEEQEQRRIFDAAGREVEQGAGKMDLALVEMSKGEPGFEEALNHQKAALEHLVKALAMLKPPDAAQQPKDSEWQDEEKISREQAARRLQAIRDREAERQQRRDNHQGRGPKEQVDKDW